MVHGLSVIGDLLANEPVLAAGAVTAVLVLLVAFGVPINETQKGAIVGVVSAVLAIVGAVYARSKVTPVAKL